MVDTSKSPPTGLKLGNKDRLTIDAVQNLDAFAYAEPLGGYTFDIADFGETTHFYIDPLASNKSLTSASGHDYRLPKTAAEPQTWALYD